jgi:DNA-binding response OmpR family regulator
MVGDFTPPLQETAMPIRRPILIVEDDAALSAKLADMIGLEAEFRIDVAGSAAEAKAKLAKLGARYDAILLDIGLPDANGCDLCAEFRQGGHSMPILMLTGANAEADVVRGLSAGANDCIAKPFRINEVLARVRAQLRSFDNSDHAVLTIGPYQFRPSAKLLHDPARNLKLRLTGKESAILKFLHRLSGKPATREVLLSEVWGYNNFVSTRTLKTHICRLRQKIEANPAQPDLLLTAPGGYQLGGIVSFEWQDFRFMTEAENIVGSRIAATALSSVPAVW